MSTDCQERSVTGPKDISPTSLDLLVRFEDEALGGRSPLTVQKITGCVTRFGRWLQPKGLLDATTADVSRGIDFLGVAPVTRGANVGMLHRFYNWALNQGLVERDPTAPLLHIRLPVTAGELPKLLRAWVIAQERRNLSPATIEKRTCALRLFFDYLAPRSVTDATTTDIEKWLDSRRYRGRPIGPKARYSHISHLAAFYRWARREGITDHDPTERLDRPRLPTGVPRPISDVDLAEAMAKADSTVRAMLACAAFCGLRAKEIAGLCREDIMDHLEPPVIVVTAPKGRRQRVVPLHPRAWEALQSVLPRTGPVFAWTPDEAIRRPVNWDYRNLGNAWPAWKISALANDHLHSLGIASTLHKLRHWYATQVYGLSLDLRMVQELLGHSSPATTAIYTAFAAGKASEVVAQLGVRA